MTIVVSNNVTNVQLSDSAAARSDRLLAEAAAAAATGVTPTTTGIVRATNIAALRTNTPVANQIAIVSGYYSNGDGGGGEFYGVTGGSYTDDGGMTIVPGGGTGITAWKRIVDDKISVKWFGAKGDGLNDDTTPIQSAIDIGKPIIVPKGTYRTSSSLTFKSSIYGDGAENTIFSPISATFPVITNPPNFISFFSLKDFKIDFSQATSNTTATNTNAIGVQIINKTVSLYYPYVYEINGVHVINAYSGLYDNSGSWMSSIQRMWAYKCNVGITKVGGTTIHFSNCHASECKKSWYVEAATRCTLTSCASDGVYQDGTYAYANEFRNCSGITINGFDCESNTIGHSSGDSLFYFNACEGAVINSVFFSLNTLNAPSGGRAQMITFDNYTVATVNGANIHIGYNNPSTGSGAAITAFVNDYCRVNFNNSRIGDLNGTSGSVQALNTRGITYSNGCIWGTIAIGASAPQGSQFVDFNKASVEYIDPNTAPTIISGYNSQTIYLDVPVTAARTITISSNQAHNGKFRVVRTNSCTGSYDVTISDGTYTLATLASANTWADFDFDGSGWRCTGKGQTV